MKLKKLAFAFVAFVAVLVSCDSNDDNKPKAQFSFDGETISLKGANLYLTYNQVVNEKHAQRNYFITDGTYTNGDGNVGWTLGDYEGATYYLAIVLSVPVGEELGKGNYPQLNNWDLAGDDDNFSYIGLVQEDETEYYTDDTNGDDSPVVISGGVEHDDKMTLSFSGKLTFFQFDGHTIIDKTVSGKINFTGTVRDVRVGIE